MVPELLLNGRFIHHIEMFVPDYTVFEFSAACLSVIFRLFSDLISFARSVCLDFTIEL